MIKARAMLAHRWRDVKGEGALEAFGGGSPATLVICLPGRMVTVPETFPLELAVTSSPCAST